MWRAGANTLWLFGLCAPSPRPDGDCFPGIVSCAVSTSGLVPRVTKEIMPLSRISVSPHGTGARLHSDARWQGSACL